MNPTLLTIIDTIVPDIEFSSKTQKWGRGPHIPTSSFREELFFFWSENTTFHSREIPLREISRVLSDLEICRALLAADQTPAGAPLEVGVCGTNMCTI